MSIPRTGSSPLDNQTDDDLIAPAPRVLQGGLLKMGVLVVTTPVTPLLLSATPADNSGTVGVSNDIVLHFNTAVQAGSGSIVISDGHTQSYINGSGALASRIVGATDTRTLSLSDSQVVISGDMVTITLSTPLKAGTGYSVTMAAGVLTDTSDNHVAYAGLTNTSLLNFTTSTSASAPAAAIIGTIHFTDTGTSSTDYVTNSAAQTLSGTYGGTLHTGEFVQVSLDNGANWHLANNDGSGHWGYSGSSISASSTMLARVSNTSGLNSGTISQAYTYISSAPPNAIVGNAITFSADSGSCDTDLITNTALQTISGTYSQPLVAGERVEVSINGSDWFAANVNNTTHTWSYAGITLDVGTHTVMARVINDFNSFTTPAQQSYTYDNVAPAVSLTLTNQNPTLHLSANAAVHLYSESETGPVGSDVTSHTTPGFQVSGLSDLRIAEGEILQIVDVNHGSQVIASYTISSEDLDHYGGLNTGVVSVWLDEDVGDLSDGTHNLVARIADLAGNTGAASAPSAIIIDTAAPAANISSATLHLAANQDSGANTGDNITNIQMPHISVSLTGIGGLQAGDLLKLYDGEGPPVGQHLLLANELDGSGHLLASQIDIQVSKTLSDGYHSISLRIEDLAGNQGTFIDNNLGVTIDTCAPSLACVLPDLDIGSDSGNPGTADTDNWTDDATPTINVELGASSNYADGDVVQLLDDGNLVASVTLHPLSMNVSSNLIALTVGTALSDGDHHFTTRIIDVAGNTGAASDSGHTLTVTIDTVPPPSMAAVTPDLADSSDDGNSSTDNHTSNTMPTITVDLSSISGFNDGDLLILAEGGTELGRVALHPTAPNGYGTKIDFTLSQPLSVGEHNLHVVTQDAVGHNGIQTDAGHLLTVTVEAVETPVQDPPPAPTDIALNDDTISASETDDDLYGERADGISKHGTIAVSGLTHGDVQWSYSTQGGQDGSWQDGSGDSFELSPGSYSAGQIQVKQTFAGHDSAITSNTGTIQFRDHSFDAQIDTHATSSFGAGAVSLITGKYSNADGLNDEIIEVSLNGGNSWVRAQSLGFDSGDQTGQWILENVTVNSQGILVRVADAAGNLSKTIIDGIDYDERPIQFGVSSAPPYTPTGDNVIIGGSGDDSFVLGSDILEQIQNDEYSGLIAGGGGENTLNLLSMDNSNINLSSLVHGHISDMHTIQVRGTGNTVDVGDAELINSIGYHNDGAVNVIIVGDSDVHFTVDSGVWTADSTSGNYGAGVYHDSSGNITLTLQAGFLL